MDYNLNDVLLTKEGKEAVVVDIIPGGGYVVLFYPIECYDNLVFLHKDLVDKKVREDFDVPVMEHDDEDFEDDYDEDEEYIDEDFDGDYDSVSMGLSLKEFLAQTDIYPFILGYHTNAELTGIFFQDVKTGKEEFLEYYLNYDVREITKDCNDIPIVVLNRKRPVN